MKLIDEWKIFYLTPSPRRFRALALLTIWVVAAVWGWFGVESTVLRDNVNARNLVDIATVVLPWLEKIKLLGGSAEKALFLHCVYYLVSFPMALFMLSTGAENKTSDQSKEGIREYLIGSLVCFLMAFLVVAIYLYNLETKKYGLHRTGYIFGVSELTVPIVAPAFIFGFWCFLLGGIFSMHRAIKVSFKMRGNK